MLVPTTSSHDFISVISVRSPSHSEIQGFRTRTLLTTDYKIFAKILTRRLKKSITHVVSHPQLGFVPGRRIGEGTHLLKLIQAALEEEDEEGILVAADWEKAFDRVSWDYLHQAAEALGFGQHIRRMLGLMYNDDAPPMRRTRVNGARSDPFSIHSGVPQGCPASPLIFLLVAEALTIGRSLRGCTLMGNWSNPKG